MQGGVCQDVTSFVVLVLQQKSQSLSTYISARHFETMGNWFYHLWVITHLQGVCDQPGGLVMG